MNTAPGTETAAGGGTLPGRRTRIPAVDGVRGAAVAAVLLFHAGHLTGGWLGVDLFFVLSGFLITTLLLGEHAGRGTISLSAFWARRARRLLPAVLLMLIGVGVYALVVAAPGALDQIRADALATLGYAANWRQIAHGHSYWDLFRSPSPLEHTWSLAIEEQFYLIWPLVLVVVFWWRRSAPAVLAVSLVGIAASFTAMLLQYSPGSDPQRVYLGTDTRASSILIGAALAALVAVTGWTPRRMRRAVLEVLGLLGAGFLGWAWLRLSGSTPAVYEGLLLACSGAAVLVIAAVAHPSRGLLARVLSFQPLRALGWISYGVYLWHWPVYLVLDTQQVGLTGWALTGVRIATTLAIAVASYVLVEAPIRHGALAGWRIRVLTPVAVAATVVIVVVTTTVPVAPHTNPAVALRHLTQPASAQSVSGFAPPTTPPRPFRLMVTGDSIAYRLMPAFLTLQGQFAYSVTDETTVGCAMERGATGRRIDQGSAPLGGLDCSTHWHEAVLRDQPDVVVVSLAGQVVGDWQIAGQWLHPCDAAYDAWFERQVVEGLSLLTAGGARVVVALPAPTFDQNFSQRTECIRATELRASAAVANASIVDFKKLLREDGMHYRGPAAELVVRWLGLRLQRLAAAPSPVR